MEFRNNLIDNIKRLVISKADPRKRLRLQIKEAFAGYSDDKAFSSINADDIVQLSSSLKTLLSRLFELGKINRAVPTNEGHVQVFSSIQRAEHRAEDPIQLRSVPEYQQFQLDVDKERLAGCCDQRADPPTSAFPEEQQVSPATLLPRTSHEHTV